MKVERLTSITELPAIELAGIVDRSIAAGPFSQMDFLAACSAAVAPDTRPMVLAAYSGNDLVGVLPLGRQARHVGPIETGLITSIAPRLVDLTMAILRPEAVQDAIAALSGEIRRIRQQANEIDIRYVASNDPLLHQLLAGNRIAERRQRRASMLGAEWQQSISDGHQRREIQRCRRRLAEAGAKLSWASNSTQVADYMEMFGALHGGQQALLERRPSLFASPMVRRELGQVLSRWCSTGAADIGLLMIDDNVLAGYILFHNGATTWAWRTSHDQRWRNMGPGAVMLSAAVERAIERGSGTYDFGVGDEQYKSAWSVPSGEALRIAAPAGGVGGIMARTGKWWHRSAR